MKYRYPLLAAFVAFGLNTSVQAAPGHLGYYRYADIHKNEIIFTSEGDIWTMKLGQKEAHRLTSRPDSEFDAVISPNGHRVAFVAKYEGAYEAYVMPITGGQPKRVTFEQSYIRLQGWTKSGQLLYSAYDGQGPADTWVLKEVDPSTLKTTDIPLLNADQGSIDTQRHYIYFTRFGRLTTDDNNAAYRGGAEGVIWRYKLGSHQEAQRLTQPNTGSNSHPMYDHDRVYFVSDKSGIRNLWSMATDGSDVKQLTHYKEWPVLGPRLNNGRIIFQQGADLVLYNIAKNSSKKLNIRLATDEPYRQEQWIKDPMDYLTTSRISPNGKRAVLTARGKIAIANTRGERLIQIPIPKGSRARYAILSKNGQWVYAICDASGEQEIWRFAADGSHQAKQLTHGGHSIRWSLSESPDGKHLLTDDIHGNLWLVNAKTGLMKKLASNGPGIQAYSDRYAWSSDSRYLAVDVPINDQIRAQIILFDLKTGRHQIITSDKYDSYSPAFTPDGKWLYFLSNRSFNATPSGPWGDRNLDPVFNKRTDIFAIALDPNAPFPFQKPNELMNDHPKDTGKIQWDGMAKRLWQVPVKSGNYSNLHVTHDRLYFLNEPLGAQENHQTLYTVKMAHQFVKRSVFERNVDGYGVSANGEQILMGRWDDLYIVPTDSESPDNLDKYHVDTSSWRMAINPKEEWMQMFRDAWLMHRDNFYDPTMRGVNWLAVKKKFQPLVSRVSGRYELDNLLSQMISPLNAMHSQVYGGHYAKNIDSAKAADLGARLKQTDQGVEITHIYLSDPEVPAMASPLDKPGVNAQNGDIIQAINGIKVSTLADVVRLLRNQAGQQVLLTLERHKKTHKTIVYPVSRQRNMALRTQDWAEINREKVAKLSHGKIGYIYLQAMESDDFDNFVREFYANYLKDGLIIDVRNNEGGNIDSWVIDKLLRRAWMFWQPRHGVPSVNMPQAFRGHLAVLVNQLTYSDGETFSAGIKALGLAPLIGMRTAGAGVWLSDQNTLSDGGMARVAQYPQFQLSNGHWIVEEHGVEPTIKVENLPYASYEGKDAQLLKAIDYLKQEIKQKPLRPLKPSEPIYQQKTAGDVIGPKTH